MMIYEDIYKKLKQLLPNLETIDEAVKLKASGYMDLNVDVLERTSDSIRLALSHYYKHSSGDMIPDPDMEIRIWVEQEMAEALTYQDIYCYRTVYPQEGYINVEAKTELNDFLNLWLNNLLQQGHKVEESN